MAMNKAAHLDPAVRRTERPDPDDVRGTCPVCGSEVVSGVFYIPGVNQKGAYCIVWSCWESEGSHPSCDYVRLL